MRGLINCGARRRQPGCVTAETAALTRRESQTSLHGAQGVTAVRVGMAARRPRNGREEQPEEGGEREE